MGKSSIRNIPLFGRIAVANRTIFIDRMAAKSSSSAQPSVTDQIVERLRAGGKVGMFPEGTTSNGTGICPFKSGAFVAGVPVVPLIFKYPYCSFDPAFCSVSLKWQMLGTLAQGVNFMTAEYLPVYYPSEAEKNDPKLYAANVRKVMLDASGLLDNKEVYEDKLKWEKEVGYLNKEVAAKEKKEEEARRLNAAGSDIEVTSAV